MIDWAKTAAKFGTTQDTAKRDSAVVATCSVCNVDMDRRYRSTQRAIKSKGVFRCQPCATRSAEFKAMCAARAAALWQDPAYAANNLAAVQSDSYREAKRVESTDRWRDCEFRAKMTSPTATAKRKLASSKSAQKLWRKQAYRDKLIDILSTRTKLQWQGDEYKSHMRTVQSQNAKSAWNAGVFDNSFGDEFKSKMSIVNSEINARQDVKQKRSAASKAQWADPEYRAKMAVVRANQPRLSNIQTMLYGYLNDLNIIHHREGDHTAIGYYTFDCLIPSDDLTKRKHLLIECQGDYWHSLPRAVRNDKSKFAYIERYFPDHEIMYLWEHEFYANGKVLNRIKLKLGVDVNVVDFKFSDVSISVGDGTAVRSFLDSYHYIGKGRGGQCFGATIAGELIGCAVYSPPLRQNTAGQFGLNDGEVRELSRFCIHPSYQKKNFASWLLSKTLSKLDCKLVVSYADTTVGHVGTIYKATGFTLHHEVPADYWYVDDDGFVMHKRTLYGRASKMSLTESEFALKHGYIKRWGDKKLCYVKNVE